MWPTVYAIGATYACACLTWVRNLRLTLWFLQDPMKTLGDSSSVKYKAEEASEDEDDFASADENEREERGTGPDESEDRAKTQTRQPKPPPSRKNATEQKTEED